MTERYDWAKDYAAKIRKDLKDAVKDGRLPEGSKVGARKNTASMLTEVNAYVDPPNPEKYYDADTGAFNQQGRDLARTLDAIVRPYLDKDDGRHSFVNIRLDGRSF